MDVPRFRTNQSDFVLEPDEPVQDWTTEKERGWEKTAADKVRKRRLDLYRELAALGLPIARYR